MQHYHKRVLCQLCTSPKRWGFNITHMATFFISELDHMINLTFLPWVIILQGGPSPDAIYSFR